MNRTQQYTWRAAPRLASIAPSVITSIAEAARKMMSEGIDLCSLSVGEPDFRTDPNVMAAAKAAMDRGGNDLPSHARCVCPCRRNHPPISRGLRPIDQWRPGSGCQRRETDLVQRISGDLAGWRRGDRANALLDILSGYRGDVRWAYHSQPRPCRTDRSNRTWMRLKRRSPPGPGGFF